LGHGHELELAEAAHHEAGASDDDHHDAGDHRRRKRREAGLVAELGEVHVRDGADLRGRQRGDAHVDAELAAGHEEVGDVADEAFAENPDAERPGQVGGDDDPVDDREVHARKAYRAGGRVPSGTPCTIVSLELYFWTFRPFREYRRSSTSGTGPASSRK